MRQDYDGIEVALGFCAALAGVAPALLVASGALAHTPFSHGSIPISGFDTLGLAFAGLALAAGACARVGLRVLALVLAVLTLAVGGLACAAAIGVAWPAAMDALLVDLQTSGTLPPSVTAAACFTVFAIAALGSRRMSAHTQASVHASTALLFGAVATAALVGSILRIDLLQAWHGSSPVAANIACGMLLLAGGLWRSARRSARDALTDEARRIKLTAIIVLSLVAVVTGVATFAAADREYDLLAKEQLDRSAREKRAFVQYALDRHVAEVRLASERLELERELVALDQQPGNAHARQVLAKAAAALVETGFVGWRYETLSGESVAAGEFVENTELRIALIGPMRTELIWQNGYFLRTSVRLVESGQLQGHAVAVKALRELDKIMLEVETGGGTGEIELCGGVDNELTCFPLRANPKVSRYVKPVDGHASPMARALERESGLMQTLDSRQHQALAAYGPVGTTGLGMVMKIDSADLHAALARSFGNAVILMLLLVSAGVAIMRYRLRPLTEALVQARIDAGRNAGRFRGAAASSLDAYFLLEPERDARGRIHDFRLVYMNSSAEVLMSRASEDVLNQTIGSVLPGPQAQFLIARYRSIVESGHSLAEEFRSVDPGVVARWVAHQAVKLGDGVSVTARDITRHKELEARLREMAEKDALTGLPNRALFFDRLESALARARRAGSGLSVLYLDLDRFKEINDTHGHAIGDRVLVEFARRLLTVVRATDTVARLAGDEFAVVLEGALSPEDAERACNAILQAMAEPFQAGELTVRIATSIGMAFSREGDDAIDDLLARADRCLYEAKQAGRNGFVMEGQDSSASGAPVH